MTEVHVITASNRHLYPDILEQSFHVRYDVFVRERGWNALIRPDHRDVDAYDREDAVYLLALDGERVVGGTRFCPTLRPHMLTDVFAHLAQVKGAPRGPDVWEWSRYFVIKERRSGRTDCRLLAAVQEFGLEEGITTLTAVVEAWWLPRFQEAGFRIRPLGLPALVEEQWSLAVAVEISQRSLNHVRDFARIRTPMLVRHGPQHPVVGRIDHVACH